MLKRDGLRCDSLSVWMLCCGARNSFWKLKLCQKRYNRNAGMLFVRVFLSEVANFVQIIDNDDDRHTEHLFWRTEPTIINPLPLYLLSRTQLNMIKRDIKSMLSILLSPDYQLIVVSEYKSMPAQRTSSKVHDQEVLDQYVHYTFAEEPKTHGAFVFLTPFIFKICGVWGVYNPQKPCEVYWQHKTGYSVPIKIGFHMMCLHHVKALGQYEIGTTIALLDRVINNTHKFLGMRYPITKQVAFNPEGRRVLCELITEMDPKFHYLIPMEHFYTVETTATWRTPRVSK